MIRRIFAGTTGEVRVMYEAASDVMTVHTRRAPTWIWSPDLPCIANHDDPKGTPS
jgi:hypothetical protein